MSSIRLFDLVLLTEYLDIPNIPGVLSKVCTRAYLRRGHSHFQRPLRREIVMSKRAAV